MKAAEPIKSSAKGDLNWYNALTYDKCLTCKLIAAPMFVAVGSYFAVTNMRAWQEEYSHEADQKYEDKQKETAI